MEQEDINLRSDADNFSFSSAVYAKAADGILQARTYSKFKSRLAYMEKHVGNNPDFKQDSERLMTKFYEAIKNKDGMFNNEQKAYALMASNKLHSQVYGKDVDQPGNMANGLYDEAMSSTFQEISEANLANREVIGGPARGSVQAGVFNKPGFFK